MEQLPDPSRRVDGGWFVPDGQWVQTVSLDTLERADPKSLLTVMADEVRKGTRLFLVTP